MSFTRIEINELIEGTADDTKTTFLAADQEQTPSAFSTFKFKLLDLLKVFSVRLPEGEHHVKSEQELSDIFEIGATGELFIPDGTATTIFYDASFTQSKVWKLGAGSSLELARTSSSVELTLSDTMSDYFISMKNPDTETFGVIVLDGRLVIKEQTPDTNTLFYLKASPTSRFEISNNISVEEVKWVGAVVNEGTTPFVYTIQNSVFRNVRQGISIVNGLGEIENFGSLKGASPAAFDRKTSLSFVSDDAVATDYVVGDTKLITLPTEAGIYFRPTTNVTTRYVVRDTDILGGGDGLKTDITPITINSVQDDGNNKAQFNVTATEEPVLGEVVENSGFTTNTAYNKARPVIAQGSGFYVLDIPFGSDESGGSFQTGSAQSDNINVVSKNNIAIATSMIVGGFKNNGTVNVGNPGSTFVDFDFSADPIVALTNQERFNIIDADTGEFEYTGQETLVIRIIGTLNAGGGTGGAGGGNNGSYLWKIQKALAATPTTFVDITDSQPANFGFTSNEDSLESTFLADVSLSTGDRLKPQLSQPSTTRSDFELRPFIVSATP